MTTTRDKRASAVGILLPWGRITPTPDAAAEDNRDRAHLAALYRGALPAATAELEIIWSSGGTFENTLEIVWSSGGRFSSELVVIWASAPSAARIEMALIGTSGLVRSTYRFEKRTRAGLFLADVSAIVEGGYVEHNEHRAVKRAAEFYITPALDPTVDLDPVVDHIMPIMRLLVDGVEVDIPLGLFKLNIPEEESRHTHDSWRVGGEDLASHLVNDYIDAPYAVAAGANPISGTNGVRDLLDAAGIPHAIPDTTAVLTAALAPLVGTPKLTVVNLLLEAASMYHLSINSAGVARSRVQADLSTRTPDVTYPDTTWLMDPIGKKREVTRFANAVLVVSLDPENLFSSLVENTDPNSSISIPNLGVKRVKKIEVSTLPDQAAAEEIGRRYLEREAGMYEARAIQTFPDPRREFNEVVSLEVAGVAESWFVQDWRLDLQEGRPMRWHLGKVERVDSEIA